MKEYMLDSNIYRHLLDDKVDLKILIKNGQYLTTNVQMSEALNIKDVNISNKIIYIYESLHQQKVQLQTGIWLDDLHWDDEQEWKDDIGSEAEKIYGNSKRIGKWKDALIGEAAKYRNCTIVTEDGKFSTKCDNVGIKHISYHEFLFEVGYKELI